MTSLVSTATTWSTWHGPSISFDLRGRIDPSDVVQETLCQVLAGQPRERTDGQMMGWLRLKLHDNLVERFRRHRLDRHIVSLDRLLDQTSRGMSRFMWASQSGPDARLIRVEDARKLADRLAKLSDAQAEAIVLKHCEGMSVKEICRHMNKTPEAVGWTPQARYAQAPRTLVTGRVIDALI